MNNNDLLILAKAMGKNAQKYMKSEPNDYVILFNEDLKKIGRFNPKKNNDQFLEVFEWLYKIGHFSHLGDEMATYFLTNGKRFCSAQPTFKETVLSIAIQVSRELHDNSK